MENTVKNEDRREKLEAAAREAARSIIYHECGLDFLDRDYLKKVHAVVTKLLVDFAAAREREAIEQSAEIKTLKEIARLTNLFFGGGCCEEHHRATEREINRLLGLFEDDGFEKLKARALLPSEKKGEAKSDGD